MRRPAPIEMFITTANHPTIRDRQNRALYGMFLVKAAISRDLSTAWQEFNWGKILANVVSSLRRENCFHCTPLSRDFNFGGDGIVWQ